MGCNSSTTTSASEQIRTGEKKQLLKGFTGAIDGSTGGKTLLRAHTTVPDGSPKTAHVHFSEMAEVCTVMAEPAAEAPVGNSAVQEVTEEVATNEPITFEQDEDYIKAYLSAYDATQHEHEDKEGCPNIAQSMICPNADADTGKPCDLVETEQNLRVRQEETCAATSLPMLFVKGDFVSICGPAVTGKVDLQGKTGRIVNVDDTHGCELSYEVGVGETKAWFKPSALEKSKALAVMVTGDVKNDAAWCPGTPGFLQCCTDVPR